MAELAAAIVCQVKDRGPFLSLADSANRRPGIQKQLALSGALLAALEDPLVSINKPIIDGRSLPLATAASDGFKFPEAEAGSQAVGTVAHVKQGDLLTTLAPFISVRGDTFMIRSYGEVVGADGKVLAKAWCEAVVQRLPTFIDPVDAPHEPLADLEQINRTFGRRFEIVSFRYLLPQEVGG